MKDWRYILLSLLLMGAGVFCVLKIFSNIWAQLIIGGLSGIAIYIVCCVVMGVIDMEMLNMFRQKIAIWKNRR